MWIWYATTCHCTSTTLHRMSLHKHNTPPPFITFAVASCSVSCSFNVSPSLSPQHCFIALCPDEGFLNPMQLFISVSTEHDEYDGDDGVSLLVSASEVTGTASDLLLFAGRMVTVLFVHVQSSKIIWMPPLVCRWERASSIQLLQTRTTTRRYDEGNVLLLLPWLCSLRLT